MTTLSFTLDPQNVISAIDPRLFGSFIEHLGRAVYTGVYEPEHPLADEDGFRQDVIDLVKGLHVTTVRYPGGNYVSGFNWRDSIGPKEERPVRLDYAWISKETNQFGIEEFARWCEKTGVEPMIAVNLGTGTPQEAGYFAEYCNHPGGTTLSDLRIQHGRREPYNFRLWCLGNEMDGPWQTGQMNAREYAHKARETAKILRCIDPQAQLVACGSSSSAMTTFPEWDRIVLEELYDYVDFISCHQYYENEGSETDFLASFVNMDNFIDTIVSTATYAKAVRRSNKEMMISFDEWNVWYLRGDPWDAPMKDPANRFREAPPLLEDRYSFLDALVMGGLLCSLLNHADRVKMASLAQLVNVIAPIFTEPGKGALCQTLYWPFEMVASVSDGVVLRHQLPVPTFESKYGDARSIQSSVVYNEARGEIYIFAVNCDFTTAYELDINLPAFSDCRLKEHKVLRSDDLYAKNTFDDPNRVHPEIIDYPHGSLRENTLTLSPLTWNRITLSVARA
ncbi:alpha-N-arabinofuranosidase [Cronobacter turicensis]|nr:alpha-N-arabinofuranosidase [Cronobacter turicensis]ELQ6271051.1 alpha-N-arabinofuranosidase [Cronobacter turicensis]